MKKIIKGFKGFDKNLQCRGFQFEEGKEFKQEGDVELCNKGFHFCENPLDVFSYYPPTNGNTYAPIEALGTTKKEEEKSATNHIKIGMKLELKELITSSVEFIFEKSKKIISNGVSATTGNGSHSATTGDWAHSATTGNWAHSATTGNGSHSATTGNWAHSATTGDGSHSATTGDRAHSATTGDGAHSATTGDWAISACLGINSQAKAALGSFIVIAEWEIVNNNWTPIKIHSAKVDGKKIKADTFYKAENGKLIEVK